MNKETNTVVDTRVLKNGKIRLRLRLNALALEKVEEACDLTERKYINTAIDDIAMSFNETMLGKTIDNSVLNFSLACSAHGRERFLVKLYPDQYPTVRDALNLAREFVKTDSDALVLMCLLFIESEMNYKS